MLLRKGTLLQNGEYKIIDILGIGGFGIIYLAFQHNYNRMVAIKEFFMNDICKRHPTTLKMYIAESKYQQVVDAYRQKFHNEAYILFSMENKNIVKTFDLFVENDTEYYVMEYIVDGQPLSKCSIQSLEHDPLDYICQIANALSYMHKQHIAHLDINSDNIIIQDRYNHATLIDFGSAKQYKGEELQHKDTFNPISFSDGYSPIELYQKGGVDKFAPASDIYSLGAVLYEIYVGKTPPDANFIIKFGLPALPPNIPLSVKNTIENAMQPYKQNRIQTITEFLNSLHKS